MMLIFPIVTVYGQAFQKVLSDRDTLLQRLVTLELLEQIKLPISIIIAKRFPKKV